MERKTSRRGKPRRPFVATTQGGRERCRCAVWGDDWTDSIVQCKHPSKGNCPRCGTPLCGVHGRKPQCFYHTHYGFANANGGDGARKAERARKRAS